MNKRVSFLSAAILSLLSYNLPLHASNSFASVPGTVSTISFPGLPAVTYDEIQSRLSAVRVDGRVILIVVSALDGAVQSMDAPGRWSWRFAPGGGNIHHRFAVTGGHGQYDGDIPMTTQQLGEELPVFLDTVRDELGLPEVWQKTTVVRSVGPDGYDVLDSGTLATILRLRRSAGDVRVGFGASGQPLFYDLRLPLTAADSQGAAVPTRLIVSHTGRIQLALAAPRQNAITSVIWSADPTVRGVTYQHFVLEIPAGSGRMHSLMAWTCGHYYSCYDDPTAGFTCWWEDQYCNSPDPPPAGPPDDGGGSGGGGGGAQPPETPQRARDLYVANCPEVPDASQFLDRSGYNATELSNYFSFDNFKSPSSNYVLVDHAMVIGLGNMQGSMDTVSLPGLSKPGDGAGYRIPNANADTPCGDHCYGRAVDLSIYNNSSGGHDCGMWNLLAAAANSAGGWVEPASMIVANSQNHTLDHFHVAWDGRTNNQKSNPPQPLDYGDGCNP